MTNKSFRSSASFGKRQEYVAMAELLKRGYDVYLTLVDDQGIDCIVRQGPDRYFDIQIKARSKVANPRHAGQFPQILVEQPRDNYIFIFYSEAAGDTGTHWVIPSTKFVEPGFCNTRKSGKNKGQHRLMLTNYSSARKLVIPRPKYKDYVNAYETYLGKPPHPNL